MPIARPANSKELQLIEIASRKFSEPRSTHLREELRERAAGQVRRRRKVESVVRQA
jgi:hypothetical protein